MPQATYIGIDPGANGGAAAIQGSAVTTFKFAKSTSDGQWQWLAQWIGEPDVYVLIEQQTARPTWIPDHQNGGMRQTVLASTVMLYGSYRDLRTMALCAALDFRELLPHVWQAGMLLKRPKGQKDHQWKGTLKAVALSLFPTVQATLWNSDALLLAAYCQQLVEDQQWVSVKSD